MAERKYYWLKLQDGFFDSKRIKKLRKLAGGDTYTIIYLKMQLVAMKKGGVLEYTGLEKTFAEELALELDEEPENVAVTVSYLLSCGLLEESQNSTEYFVPYAVMNTGSESSSTRRVREHRERKALHCNTDETPVKRPCNTEIEIEKEKEIDIEGDILADEPPAPPPISTDVTEKKSRKKAEIKQPPVDFSDTGFSEFMIIAIEKWLMYKTERREAYKPTGLQSLITQIKNNVNKYGEKAVIALIVECMAANYKGIIFERLEKMAKVQLHNGHAGTGFQTGNPFLEMRGKGLRQE